MPKTKSLVLIVWNEIGGCKADVPKIDRSLFDEIFAIDGGSTDGTVEYLESLGIAVHRQRKKSLNAAYADAAFHAKSGSLVIFFPKATLDPLVLGEFCERLDQGYELIVASRNMAGAHNEEDESFFKPRKWGVAVLSLTAALIWRREGWRIRDVLHGVKAYTKEAYQRMQVADVGVTIDLEMTVRAYRLRIPRVEFPVIEKVRPHGETRFKIWPTGRRLARFLASELFRKL